VFRSLGLHGVRQSSLAGAWRQLGFGTMLMAATVEQVPDPLAAQGFSDQEIQQLIELFRVVGVVLTGHQFIYTYGWRGPG
jgi:hypothetical protein